MSHGNTAFTVPFGWLVSGYYMAIKKGWNGAKPKKGLVCACVGGGGAQ